MSVGALRIPPLARLPTAIAVAAFAFLGLFLLYPLWGVFIASLLTPDGTDLTLQNYVKVLSKPFYRASVANTLSIGLIATATTTLIAVPLAVCVARLPIPGKSLLLALAALPLVLPSFVAAYALVLLFGRSGAATQALHAIGLPFGSIFGKPGIIVVYTLTLYPYVLLPVLAGLKAIDVSVEEAAQSLGSSPARTFWTVTLPVVSPAVLAGALLVFIETLENFGVPAVLAEDMPILAVEAYKLFVGETAANPSAAGVLGVLLILSTATVLAVQRRYLSSRRFATGARRTPPPIAAGPGWRALAAVYCWSVVLLALVPF
ncbi:MAG: ABC transporter permease, partial [Hyphomicrobiaceae bacterium]